jgi:C1A family cysteine protease
MYPNTCRTFAVVLLVLTVLTVFPRLVSCQATPLPPSFDWAEQGIMTPAKDQGDFGTCWAFASVGLLEALIRKEQGLEVDLSEQFLISNINGIGPFQAMEFLETRGDVREDRLPYRGDTSSENTDLPGEFFLGEHGVINVNDMPLPERIATIKRTIHEYGPVVTTMNLMDDFRFYESGVYVYDGVSPEQPGGHIILLTGWADDSSVVNGGYWIVKNSAGTGWGYDGFGRAAYGQAGIDDYYVIHGALERSGSM